MQRHPQTDTRQPEEKVVSARKKALQIAHRNHGAFILDYFKRKTKDVHAAEDLFQRFWLHVYEKFRITEFNNIVRLRHKAYQIFVDDFRYWKVRNTVEHMAELPDQIDERQHMPHFPEEAERMEREWWELFPDAQLTELQKKAFTMKTLEKYTYREISSALNVSVSTLHDWINTVIDQCEEHYRP